MKEGEGEGGRKGGRERGRKLYFGLQIKRRSILSRWLTKHQKYKAVGHRVSSYLCHIRKNQRKCNAATQLSFSFPPVIQFGSPVHATVLPT